MNADEIRSMLRLLVEIQAVATIEHVARSTSLRAVAFDADEGSVTWDLQGILPRLPFVLRANGYNSVYRLPIESATEERGDLVTRGPRWIERARSRRTKRVDVVAGLRVMFDHPTRPQLRIERDVLDLTQGGLSFRAHSNDDPVLPGMSSAAFFVTDRDGHAVRLCASVRTYRWLSQHGAYGFGCEIEPATPGDARLWQRLCDTHLFPATRRGAAEVWSVYRASGYFGLSDTIAGDFEHLRASHVDASRALSRAPHLGVQSTWPKAGEPRATVANLRLYQNSWFSFHLAVQPDQVLATRTGQVLRDLYRHYVEHSVGIRGPRWQIAYVQDSAHWSMRMHVEIPQKYAATGHGLVREFRAYDVRTVGSKVTSRSGYRVQSASSQETAALIPLLTARQDAAYCDALDYAPDLFELGTLKADWARHGLERERQLLVAYARDTPVALGVVECAEPGLHLFGLLDTLRLYALQDDGAGTFDLLIDEARAWFRQRNRRTFCYLEEEGNLGGNGRDIKLMSRAFFTLLSVERLPEMLETLYAETANTPGSFI